MAKAAKKAAPEVKKGNYVLDSLGREKERMMPLERIVEASERAGRYQSFPEFLTQVVISGYKQFGWVDHRFYELWPGGRCIEWTNLLPKGVVRPGYEPLA
jgi:hypothetical protein